MNKKAIIGTSIASGIMLLGAVSFATTKKLVKIALDREPPANIEMVKSKISASKGMKDFCAYMNEGEKRLKSCYCERVEIKSSDGTKLVGHYKKTSKPERILIAMHGWRSRWSYDFGTATDFWESSNCSVLYPEQRGHSSSGGNYMGFGMLERNDCLAWANWVKENNKDNIPVYLFGVSMGATTVLMSSALDLPDDVRGIIADCGFTSPKEIWRHVAKNNLHLPYKLREKVAEKMCQRKINMSLSHCSAVDALKNCKLPVLLIHGAEDRFVPVEMTYENYKACASPKRLFIVPGADHGMSYYKDKAGYEKVLMEFWQDYDKYN